MGGPCYNALTVPRHDGQHQSELKPGSFDRPRLFAYLNTVRYLRAKDTMDTTTASTAHRAMTV